MWMNEGDVEDAVYLLNTKLPQDYALELPNLARGARILERLMRWTNRNSDGWPYWAKPGNAAKKLQEALHNVRRAFLDDTLVDLTDAQLKAMLSPIKAFLTKQGVEHSLILDEPPPPPPRPDDAGYILGKIMDLPNFCGLGVCTGATVRIPLMRMPDPEDDRLAVALHVQCCIFCSDSVAGVVEGSEVLV